MPFLFDPNPWTLDFTKDIPISVLILPFMSGTLSCEYLGNLLTTKLIIFFTEGPITLPADRLHGEKSPPNFFWIRS